MVPEADELAAIDRELRFFPSVNPRPRTLTTDQVEAFNRDGYLFPFDVFSAEEIDGHRRYFDRLLQQEMERGGDSYSISSAHLRYPEVRDLLCEPRIVSLVADLLGEDVIGWGSHYFCKMPGDGKSVSWHQDASYWPLTPSKTITVWLAIDDADEENACMQFIRGSHLGGHLPFADSSQSEQNVLNQTVDVSSYDPPAPVVLRAGQVSLHSDLLLHGSLANRSSRRRCGLTLRYCPADVVAHLGWHRKGVAVRGAAPPHWGG
jgi:ectoine hydroxylase-related dioxygenase (phytanoyl-CoA dioxygenase family)